MGEVWIAEQSQPLRRRVALKLIKSGMDTRDVVARFESERQALALMNHPAIAKVYDAGSTTEGRPYFAMECVAGLPITVYCDNRRLTTRERLELFVQVCESVQHAHQKAILHRDLKPTNVLVMEVDDLPVPKIIDFGIAKALSQPLTDHPFLTRVGAIIGTPEYMSPEQADLSRDVDTRSDVYSLGVILYEPLVGALPLDVKKAALADILRKVREEDPPAPSTRLRMLGEASTITAHNRQTEPGVLRWQLRGDLDCIALKALEKNRARRYGAPSELAADIGRYLRNEPVSASPASLAYRAKKYVIRHRVGVSVAFTLFILLAAFTVTETLQLGRITRERDRADRIARFMSSMFRIPDPSESRGSQITARQILDKSSAEIETGLANDPEVQARMTHLMGETYWNLGLYSRAEPLFRRAFDIQRRLLGPDSQDALASMVSLAHTLSAEGKRAPEGSGAVVS